MFFKQKVFTSKSGIKYTIEEGGVLSIDVKSLMKFIRKNKQIDPKIFKK